jgi:hypothetical protein
MKLQLLCTFTNKETLFEVLHDIRQWYDIVYSSIYVLENVEDENELFITYNIEKNQNRVQLTNTILLHRKKMTNTMYTINALNELIKEKNGGKLDNTFIVDWDELRNSIIIWNGTELRKIQTKINKIIKFNTE